MRKNESIDLVKLYATSSVAKWNRFLTSCERNRDLNTLANMRYSLQAGMVDLAKKKLNSDKMQLWFIRLQTSIERTMRTIVRLRNPNPCDDPLKAANNLQHRSKKKARDHELELLLKKSGY